MASTSRKRIRYTFDIHFTSVEEKEAFQHRLSSVRKLLTPSGCPSLDNCSLMNAMFDSVEGGGPMTDVPSRDSHPTVRSFMRNSGKIYNI